MFGFFQTIAENCKGLKSIAGERIWDEVKQIVRCAAAPSLLRYMAKTGVTEMCGLPVEPYYEELENVFARGILKHEPHSATCLAAALCTQDDVSLKPQKVLMN